MNYIAIKQHVKDRAKAEVEKMAKEVTVTEHEKLLFLAGYNRALEICITSMISVESNER